MDKATTDATGHLTPLHIAAELGCVDVAMCLMEHERANLNARTIFGQRPMDLAEETGNVTMRQAIINEEERRRDRGSKRTASQGAGQASNKRARR